MNNQIITIDVPNWSAAVADDQWVKALEAGKVLHFTHLPFPLSPVEQGFLVPEIRDPKSRNISLHNGELKGAVGDGQRQQALAAMMARYRDNAVSLVNSYFPHYQAHLKQDKTSFRPAKVETRAQSVRANDKLLHVDAFPSRPTHGQRILRVFINLNPDNIPRVWRVGESFAAVAGHFLTQATPYRAWQAKLLNLVGITKSLRCEYDHLMVQLHDIMKHDSAYQSDCSQITMPFPSGSVWVCYADQVSHAVMSGQYMMEQTFHLAPGDQYDNASSPLAVLRRITGRDLL
jgi:hypothetical protein